MALAMKLTLSPRSGPSSSCVKFSGINIRIEDRFSSSALPNHPRLYGTRYCPTHSQLYHHEHQDVSRNGHSTTWKEEPPCNRSRGRRPGRLKQKWFGGRSRNKKQWRYNHRNRQTTQMENKTNMLKGYRLLYGGNEIGSAFASSSYE